MHHIVSYSRYVNYPAEESITSSIGQQGNRKDEDRYRALSRADLRDDQYSIEKFIVSAYPINLVAKDIKRQSTDQYNCTKEIKISTESNGMCHGQQSEESEGISWWILI